MTDDEVREHMFMDGDLSEWLAQKIFEEYGTITLAGKDFEPARCDEVPGYEDDNTAVLLRRKSDGQVFEAEIDVTVRPVLTPAQRETRLLELSGQMRLPGVPS